MLVGQSKWADGANPTYLRSGNLGDQIVTELNPKWYEHALRGNVFSYSSAATGITFAANPATNQPTIWNPAGSNKLFIPVRVVLGYVSGTHSAGFLQWSFQNNVGTSLATAAPFSVFTQIAGVNAVVGGSAPASAMKFATTLTYTAAPTYLRPVGLSTAALTAATAVQPFPMSWDEDGSIILAPGSSLTLTANAAIVMVAAVTIIGLELPFPPGYAP